jgi:hypothetical protein
MSKHLWVVISLNRYCAGYRKRQKSCQSHKILINMVFRDCGGLVAGKSECLLFYRLDKTGRTADAGEYSGSGRRVGISPSRRGGGRKPHQAQFPLTPGVRGNCACQFARAVSLAINPRNSKPMRISNWKGSKRGSESSLGPCPIGVWNLFRFAVPKSQPTWLRLRWIEKPRNTRNTRKKTPSFPRIPCIPCIPWFATY